MDSMKVGKLYKVISKTSHEPSHFGHTIVIIGYTMMGVYETIIVGMNFNTKREHHYHISELEAITCLK